MFKVKFTAGEVDRLVTAYWASQSKRMQEVEQEIEVRGKSVKIDQSLSRDDFLLVAWWEAYRAKRHYEQNSEDVIREKTARAFRASNEKARINTLLELNGVGYPVASAILHFFHSDVYPILSYPSLRSLGAENETYNFSFWWSYTQYFRQLATEWNVTARKLDRALWQFNRQNP